MRRQARGRRFVIAVTLATAVPTPALADVVITHDRVDCVVAERYPVIRARLQPPGEVARARVYFQARGTTHWYHVEMKSGGGVAFEGTLPRPLSSLRGFDYYIETLSPGFAQVRSQEYSARVITGSESCPLGTTTATAASTVPSALLVGVPEGAPALPPGFSGLGLAGAAGAGATGTGGISTGVLVGVGAAAAAAGVAVAVASGGEGGTEGAASPTGPVPVATPGPQPTPTPADLTGRWAGQFVEVPSTVLCSVRSDLVLDLRQSGTAVSGTFQLLIRSATPAPGDPCPVDPGDAFTGPLSGVVNGNSISLQLQISGGPSFFLHGTISGNRISGTSPPDSDGPGGSWDVTRQ